MFRKITFALFMHNCLFIYADSTPSNLGIGNRENLQNSTKSFYQYDCKTPLIAKQSPVNDNDILLNDSFTDILNPSDDNGKSSTTYPIKPSFDGSIEKTTYQRLLQYQRGKASSKVVFTFDFGDCSKKKVEKGPFENSQSSSYFRTNQQEQTQNYGSIFLNTH